MNKDTNIIIKKIDEFIRKYYRNKLIKGLIYASSLMLGFYLILNYVEFIGHLNPLIRTILFYAYLLVGLFLLGNLVIKPILKLYRFGKVITHQQAAMIIGKHFPEVADKLINLLQLEELKKQQSNNIDLILAGINQKTIELKIVPFKNAINLSKNRKYLKYLVPLVFVVLAILLLAPSSITEPTGRLIQYNKTFEKSLPYRIEVLNEKLEVMQYEDYNLRVRVKGNEIPAEFFIVSANNKLKMVKEDVLNFSHSFSRLQKDELFYITAGEFKSPEYRLKVLPKPMILDFDVLLDYPDYTGKKDEMLKNTGDLVVPEGSKLQWSFYTSNTRNLWMFFSDDTLMQVLEKSNTFKFEKEVNTSLAYKVLMANELISNPDTLRYDISVIPDMYPQIEVEEVKDSVMLTYIFFKGVIKDDYGFDKLEFNYCKINNGQRGDKQKQEIILDKLQNPQQFYHSFDVTQLGLLLGEELEYYFTVWDNDRVNGSKSVSSGKMHFSLPGMEEVEERLEEKNEEIKDDLQSAMDELLDIRKEINEVSKKLLNNDELSWEDQQQINELLQQQMSLKEKVSNMQKSNQQKQLEENRFKEINPELLEKQEQLNELLNELLKNEELNKIFEEMQKLMEEADKEKINEMLQQLQDENFDMEQALDRNLELFKQLEFEMKLEETIQKLNELAEEQNQLAEDTRQKNKDLDELQKEQENINQMFDELQDDLDKLNELNEDMEDPNEFDPMEDAQEEVDQEQEDSMESLENGKEKKASESQKNAGQKMQQMADDLFQMQQDMISSGMEEDIDSLREILENLIQLSFDQESLMNNVAATTNSDPQYTQLVRDQKKLSDDMDMVADSLFALSKRQIMIEPFVQEEVKSINSNMSRSMNLLEDRKPAQATQNQQMSMTSINNLALMLSESLEQMQMMANSSCSGGSSCKSGKPSSSGQGNKMGKMKNMQQQLNQQLEQMKDGMKQGNQKGGQHQTMSEQLVRMAAEQEAIRHQMQQYADEMEKDGQFGNASLLKRLMDEMEKTETELVNKVLTNETLIRQQDILNELLKAEEAELEREKDEKRDSNEAKNKKISNPLENIEYKKQHLKEVEMLKTISPSLNPFYKKKVNEYFYNFGNR